MRCRKGNCPSAQTPFRRTPRPGPCGGSRHRRCSPADGGNAHSDKPPTRGLSPPPSGRAPSPPDTASAHPCPVPPPGRGCRDTHPPCRQCGVPRLNPSGNAARDVSSVELSSYPSLAFRPQRYIKSANLARISLHIKKCPLIIGILPADKSSHYLLHLITTRLISSKSFTFGKVEKSFSLCTHLITTLISSKSFTFGKVEKSFSLCTHLITTLSPLTM